MLSLVTGVMVENRVCAELSGWGDGGEQGTYVLIMS